MTMMSSRPIERYDLTLPREYYTSEEWLARDVNRVFRKSWIFAGFASQLSKPGDFFTFQLVDTSVVVSRTSSGDIAAFHNICRHRGTQFCTERTGHVKKGFVCRYHGWVYDLDGSLARAPQMPSDFDTTQWPAKPVAVEVWQGLIFLNLSGDQLTSVAQALSEVDVDIYDFEHTKLVADIELTWNGNWKLISEGFQECYHCAINHPEMCQVMIAETNFEGLLENAADEDKDFLIFTADRGYAIRDGMQSFSSSGEYVSKRRLGSLENPPTTFAQIDWFPNFQAFIQPDFLHIETFLPATPTSSVFRASFLVHEDAVEGVDYNVDEVTDLLVKTLDQDKILIEAAQRGVNSPDHEPGPFNPGLESAAIRFFRRYRKLVSD